MTGPVIHDARNDRGWAGLGRVLARPESLRGIAVSAALGVLLAVSGAFFGDAVAPVGLRLVYWVPMMALGAVFGIVVSWKLFDIERAVPSIWLAWLLMTVLVSVPMSVVIWLWTAVLFFGGRPDPVFLLWLQPGCLAVAGFMSGLFMLLDQRAPQTSPAPEGAAPARLHDRLPPKLKGAVVHAVEAEDHYLKLHTSKGSDLILMRLSDALQELEGIEGAQVHRSWWVARAAVTGASRGEGRARLQLVNGLEVPVSRTYARALREAGWF